MYDLKTLSNNIRSFRKLGGLTQSELAAKLFVTAQNISKWELGQSTPDVANLCRLAEVFGITADRLLGRDSKGEGGERMVAIDGGGTKTELVLFTKDGEVLERYVGGGSNPNTYGLDAAVNEIKEGLERLAANDLGVTVINAGIAGCGSLEMARNMTARIKKLCPTARVSVTSDVDNVISAAECAEDAIAVIAGTGSSVFAKCSDGLHRFGGWGYLYDRSYSGYDLGREAIRATLGAEEGSREKTCLASLVERRLGYRPTENLSKLYSLSPSDTAALAEAVFTAYDEGDPVAAEIIETALATLAKTVKTAKAHYPTCKRIIISGGLSSREDILTVNLVSHNDRADKANGRPISIDKSELLFPSAPQVYGAAVGCIGGVKNLTKEFSEKFKNSYKSLLI